MSGKANSKEQDVFLAVAVSGGMALGLAFGLEFLGVIKSLNALLLEVLKRSGLSEPSGQVRGEYLWFSAGLLAFLLATAILNVAGGWKRTLIWVVTVILTLFWAPVLFIASHKPDIGLALVAVLWSGFCAMVYGANHVMPVDRYKDPKNKGVNHGEG